MIMWVFLAPSDVIVCEYSQERMAKKRAPVRRWPSAIVKGDLVSSRRVRHITGGKHAWLFFEGSESL